MCIYIHIFIYIYKYIYTYVYTRSTIDGCGAATAAAPTRHVYIYIYTRAHIGLICRDLGVVGDQCNLAKI